jgi:hypothetical protein
LHIRSFADGDEVVAEWQPSKEYEAFAGMLSGGIIGTLLDCHCNWSAAWHLMNKTGADKPPCTVTSEYSIKLCVQHQPIAPCDSWPASWIQLTIAQLSKAN